MEPTHIDPPLPALAQQALDASQSGDSARAISLYEQAIVSATEPDPRVHALLASEHASRGDAAKAEAGFATAVLLAPQWPIWRFQLGLIQFSMGRPAVALVVWAPLMELDASDPLVHYVRGFAVLANDDLAGAEKHFRAGLACKNDNAALVTDIENMIARMKAQGPAGGADSHVLVSNYGKQGTH
jgi:Flp pilus assembly protein TadD